ncbi:hypothetical protein I316_07520 [Kwoniella heveanensis BCC8398]|uniref:AAA+ ATPase domain-containing protein n=1 Tax=Kwoniella heveanensis BCC8398 TaxID=1296120 RepID=A0A1B9GII4_9TREE|nr:hypothetical protein I316_07520 [Kwoniella heveanensis BCC8398]
MSSGQNNSGFPSSTSVPYYPAYSSIPRTDPQHQHQHRRGRQPAPTDLTYIYPSYQSSGVNIEGYGAVDPSLTTGGGIPSPLDYPQPPPQHHPLYSHRQPQQSFYAPQAGYGYLNPGTGYPAPQSQPSPAPSYRQPVPIAFPYTDQAQQHVPYPNLPQSSPYQEYPSQQHHRLSSSRSPGIISPVNQLQPAQPVNTGIEPTLLWQQHSSQPVIAPAVVPPIISPSEIPATIPDNATPSRSLRIKLKPPSAGSQPAEMVSGRGSYVPAVQDASYSSGRPRREASQRAQQQMVSYAEVEEDEEEEEEDAVGEAEDDAEGEAEEVAPSPVKAAHYEPPRPTRSGRNPKMPQRYGEYGDHGEDDFENKIVPTSPLHSPGIGSKRASTRGKRIIDPDEEDEDEGDYTEAVRPPPRNAFPTRPTRSSMGSAAIPAAPVAAGPSYTNGHSKSRSTRSGRAAGRTRHSSADGEDFEPEEESASDDDHQSSDPLANYDDDGEEDDMASYSEGQSPRKKKTRNSTSSRRAPRARTTRNSTKRRDDSDEEYGGTGRRNLRTRTNRPDYHIPTLDEISKNDLIMDEAIAAVSRPNGRIGGVGGLGAGRKFGAGGASKSLPWSLKSKDLAQAMGDPDTSDSDDFAAPLKSAGPGPSMGNTGPVARTNAVGPSDVPNYGRINPKSNTADADPLGVDMNVTFDNVGGLDEHINQLKEMVALPLLYPELFQQFGITPPRGVLFHGPPGTGKTLLARALAASCSSGNTKIAFFMRKGADVLSKWVGEAERQLRMLFEEARACQPSIIFFDEIDGIAPVRSSKQDQIHASLVSTLLALMDGMDGRGQVIVIGATNRPDAVDPALRRPGRFDREFYFPLPNKTARKKIIQINTRKWEPQLSDGFLEQLATLTKGYGGADLRALCTESALNAIQRRYPQIYKSADRLQLETGSIHVSAKDFMMSIKKIVPSSARSTSSAAMQLPPHLVPLLSSALDRLKATLDHVLPPRKHATALEEAEFEEEEGDSFEKHMMLQSLDKLRTFRPRILVHGEAGMGQTYLGPAILHHLEGFHVQSFDLGTLMGDSTRSVEAAVIQIIVEAKRHQPSIIFVPALSAWVATISDTARSTVRALLDSIPPSDPILVLGVSDTRVEELPGDVRALFGFAPDNKIELSYPSKAEREAYFADLVDALKKPPTEFPGVLPRRKRVLEALPLAPPLPPRQPTAAELQREEEKDQAARDMIFQSFVHLVKDFHRRYRKVVSNVTANAVAYSEGLKAQAAAATAPAAQIDLVNDIPPIIANIDGDVAMTVDPIISEPSANAQEVDTIPAPDIVINGSVSTVPGSSTPVTIEQWEAHPIDIDTLQYKLLKHKYFTPADFLADIAKIEENASKVADADTMVRITEMGTAARYHVQGFDQKWMPEFERYKERMIAKKAERQKKKELAAAEAQKSVEDAAQAPSAPSAPEDDEQIVVTQQTNEDTAADHALIDSTDGEAASLKRTREDGEELNGMHGREKRSREDPMDVDPTLVHMQKTFEDLDSTSLASPSIDVASSTAISVPAPAPAPAPSEPEPIVHPPFVLPQEDLNVLRAELSALTATLNIDQLEQLRASLFDIIWRGRAEWDRREIVKKMTARLVEWAQEVEKWKESGRW